MFRQGDLSTMPENGGESNTRNNQFFPDHRGPRHSKPMCCCFSCFAEIMFLVCCNFANDVQIGYHLDSRWRNSHVLVYHGPLLIQILGVAPSTFTTVYINYPFLPCTYVLGLQQPRGHIIPMLRLENHDWGVHFQSYLPKTNVAIENPPLEDVFPIENWKFPRSS